MTGHEQFTPDATDDEYETPEQARVRLGVEELLRQIAEPIVDLGEVITEYAAFNQAEYFDPLFASGEIHEALRHMVTEPLHVANNLRSAVRFADMRNDDRALDDKMGKYGPVVVRTRTITQTPWLEVSYDSIDEVRRR